MEPPTTDGYPVRARREHFAGSVFAVATDQVELPGGEVVARDWVRHRGAVGVVPLAPDRDEVVLVRQYRHPLRRELWELPAGLRDRAGEPERELAARELAEEAGLVAARWDLLVDLDLSPGYSDERIRLYLARDLSPSPVRYQRVHEEATMTTARFRLDEAVRMVFAGEITNAAAVAGLLAAARARDLGWAPLRPA